MAEDLDAVERLLDRLEELDEANDQDTLRAELERGLEAHPDAIDLWEWEARLAVDDERYEDALGVLDDLIAAEPENFYAHRERAGVLIEVGRFEDAAADLRALPRSERRGLPNDERASIHSDLGVCLDRMGQPDDADYEFRLAAKLEPDQFPVPPRKSAAEFDTLVAAALDGIPDEFRPYLQQVVVTVRDYPGPEDEDVFQLGLYQGIARPERTGATEDHLDTIVVFKRSHELQCRDDESLREEVRRTVVHEIAHHFGIPHDDMGEYE